MAEVAFVVCPPVTRADIPARCAELADLIRRARDRSPRDRCDGGGVVACDVTGARPDAETVDLLLRLHLTAKRLGWRLDIHHATRPLRMVIALMGLTEVLRQAEQREQPLDIEEVVNPGDPAP